MPTKWRQRAEKTTKAAERATTDRKVGGTNQDRDQNKNWTRSCLQQNYCHHLRTLKVTEEQRPQPGHLLQLQQQRRRRRQLVPLPNRNQQRKFSAYQSCRLRSPHQNLPCLLCNSSTRHNQIMQTEVLTTILNRTTIMTMTTLSQERVKSGSFCRPSNPAKASWGSELTPNSQLNCYSLLLLRPRHRRLSNPLRRSIPSVPFS